MTSKELKEKVSNLFRTVYTYAYTMVAKIDEKHYETGEVGFNVALYSNATAIENDMPDIKFCIFDNMIIKVEFTNTNTIASTTWMLREVADFLDEVNAQLQKDGKFEVVD